MQHAALAWASLERLRASRPLVHNIANLVAMDVVANALLAIGALPVMAEALEEVAAVAARADALVVNIGTPSAPRVEAMMRAAARARELGRPWVLDPVGAGVTVYRQQIASELLALRPSVLRANADEVLALAGVAGGASRGVDAVRAAEEAAGAAIALAREHRTIVALTGAVDRITDGARLIEVRNGHALMARVTGLGCAASAIVGAFLAVEDDPLLAAAQALAVFGLAGEIAAEPPIGPGTLRCRLMDALFGLDEASLRARARIIEPGEARS